MMEAPGRRHSSAVEGLSPRMLSKPSDCSISANNAPSALSRARGFRNPGWECTVSGWFDYPRPDTIPQNIAVRKIFLHIPSRFACSNNLKKLLDNTPQQCHDDIVLIHSTPPPAGSPVRRSEMDKYFTVEPVSGYHNVVFQISRAFNDGALGEKFSGKLDAGQVVSAAGTIGRKLLSDTISMSVEPMGDGTFAINDAETTIHASFDDAIAAAKRALISEFK